MPGTRHAKNNTALGFFTRHERERLGNGTKKQRLGKEASKKFDSCTICLKLAENPMVCPNGDLFCKACIYESLLLQKKKIKKKFQEYQIQQIKNQQSIESKTKQKEINSFLKLDKIITGDNPKSDATSHTNIPESTASNDKEEEKKNNKNENKLNCFWIPSLTPSVVEKKIEVPDLNTYCPGCNKCLKLKQLSKLKFTSINNIERTESETDKKQKKVNDDRYMCPSCNKTLTDAMKLTVLKKCGHVICLACLKKFVSKSKSCTVCDEPCRKKSVLFLVTGGTGFSGHGNQMIASTNKTD